MRLSVVLVRVPAFLTLAILASFSMAATDDKATCVDAIGDESIAACTRAISSGRWRGAALSWAYVHRGYGYDQKGDGDRAIQRLRPGDQSQSEIRLCLKYSRHRL